MVRSQRRAVRFLARFVGSFVVLMLAIIALPNASGLLAQDPASDSPQLADKQTQVTERYRRLEELFLRLADVEADENPERAALLRRAARQSRDTFVLEKLVAASDSLKTEKFASAIESQQAAKEGLDKLLTLLLSEDRPQRIRDEKKRIANMIKELKVVERLQRSTRARTENGADLKEVGEEQQQISDRSEKVKDELKSDDENKEADESESKDNDESKGENSEGEQSKDSESKSGDEKPESKQADPSDKDSNETDSEKSDSGEMKPSEGKSEESDSKESESKPSDAPQSDSKPSESKPSESKPSESQPSDNQPSESQPSPSESSPQGEQDSSPQPSQPQSPEQGAQSQLDKAIKQMREAEKQLDDAKRNQAVEEQKKAEENLRAAIDRLEKILRQLREEEMQRELARLESRLRKMAQMQGKVLDDTKLLAAVPESQRDRQTDLKAGNLAFEEKKIVMEADRAMLLLREEGTSVAFPEVMAQIRGDMQRISERLATTKIDLVTIGIQEDVLAALEEMIGALQQAQRDLEKKKQQEQQNGQKGGGEQGEQPLVEQIAELKLIRTMETRIKATTERYAEIIDLEQSGTDEVIPLLKDLSDRQSKLYRITRDLVLKRNQ